MTSKIRHILVLLFLTMVSAAADAQKGEKASQTYNMAEEEYNIGNFKEADSILNANMSSYTGTLKAGAYRLLSLCALFSGDDAKAKENAKKMFEVNPYYTATVGDPARFVDLVEEMKRGGARMSTASQQAETLDEVPVPVTLITEDMIEASGARNLQDLLLLFVPGMTLVEGPEANVAMHGVYSVGQEKILIMLDGHRLNSRCTNTEAPDFRTSLDKIKQIEVLRGPASSLYGNVALTAVVNIITKKGHEMDGLKVSAGYGSNNTFRADFTMGKSGVDMSYSMWASIYNSKGEKSYVNPEDEAFYSTVKVPGYMYINGYNHRPSFDVGFTAQYKDFSVMISLQNSKRVTSYSQINNSQLYDYDKYRTYNGVTPGRSRQASHFDLNYEKAFGNLSIKANVYADFERCTYYDIITDTLANVNDAYSGTLKDVIDTLAAQLVADRNLLTPLLTQGQEFLAQNPELAAIVAELKQKYMGEVAEKSEEEQIEWLKTKAKYLALDRLVYKKGIYQVQSWEDYTVGATLQANYAFEWKKFRGNILAGIQGERYKMKSNTLSWGDGYNHVLVTLSENNNSMDLGEETSLSPFFQLKSYIGDKFIFNGGLRYDYKHRYDGNDLRSLSPRATLIYLINRDMNVKFGYSRSFVDAPYFYRANKLGIYPGGSSLDAETMEALQLDFNWKLGNSGLSLESNVYYNSLNNLIIYNKSTIEAMASSSALYSNAGRMRLLGWENSLMYAKGRSLGSLNLTMQTVLSSEQIASEYSESETDLPTTTRHSIKHVPSITATAVYRYKLMDNTKYGKLFLRGNATFYSRQKSPIEGYAYKGDRYTEEYMDELSAKLVAQGISELSETVRAALLGRLIAHYDENAVINARCILNAGFDYSYKPFTFSFDCYNLLNTRYAQGGSSYVPVPQQGRSIMAKVSFKF